MELGGAEKRIQALFSELSLEDRPHVPRFEKLWTRAEVTRPAPVRAFSSSVAVIAAIVLIAAAMSLSLWSWSRTTVALNIPPQEIPNFAIRPPQVAIVIEPSKPVFERQRKSVRKHQSKRNEVSTAELLSRWQSPTQSFMQAPTTVVFNSLPQLNQSAKELEAFLPKNNEVMKESNQ